MSVVLIKRTSSSKYFEDESLESDIDKTKIFITICSYSRDVFEPDLRPKEVLNNT